MLPTIRMLIKMKTGLEIINRFSIGFLLFFIEKVNYEIFYLNAFAIFKGLIPSFFETYHYLFITVEYFAFCDF
mgnify:CR=1 FL=1